MFVVTKPDDNKQSNLNRGNAIITQLQSLANQVMKFNPNLNSSMDISAEASGSGLIINDDSEVGMKSFTENVLNNLNHSRTSKMLKAFKGKYKTRNSTLRGESTVATNQRASKFKRNVSSVDFGKA